jgi:hypothetical protein
MGQYVNLRRKEVRNDEHTGREAFIEPRTGTHTDKEFPFDVNLKIYRSRDELNMRHPGQASIDI